MFSAKIIPLGNLIIMAVMLLEIVFKKTTHYYTQKNVAREDTILWFLEHLNEQTSQQGENSTLVTGFQCGSRSLQYLLKERI